MTVQSERKANCRKCGNFTGIWTNVRYHKRIFQCQDCFMLEEGMVELRP